MSVIPTESNISMVGVGLLGRTTSGAGKSSRLDAASVRSLCSVYSTSEVDTLLAGKANSSHTHAWSDITSGKPTTLAGYGITDAITSAAVVAGYQPLDADLTAIAALTTTSFGRSLLTQADAAAVRTTIGAGTSSFDGAFSSLTGTPTTISGYGITNAYTKTEVDNLVAGLLDFKGNQDCSTNPNYPSALKGDSYYVSVAGKIGGASGVTVAVGDLIVCSADNAGGTQASVGSSWFVLEKNLDGALVSSNNLSDLANAATARSNLGLGTLATQSGTFSGTSSGTNTGDQTITLTGDVTGSGTGSFAATIGAGKVTNAMLAGSIAASKLVGTDIATVGTVTSGTWSTGAVIGGATVTLGSDATGDIYYRNAGGVLTRLAIGTSGQVLTVSGGLPSWAAASGGGSPGGSSGQFQYNNAGAFGGTTAVVYAGTGTHVVVTAQSATTVPVCFKGAASQSANLSEWQNSAGTVVASVSSAGNIAVASGNWLGLSSSNSVTFGAFSGTLRSAGDVQLMADSSASNTVTIGNNQGGMALRGVACTVYAYAGTVLQITSGAGSGTNGAGSAFRLRAGAGTGSATPASILLQTTTAGASGTTAQTHRSVAELDGNTTSGETPMLLLDCAKGTLQRVSIGASDSGGTGFKVLRVPN